MRYLPKMNYLHSVYVVLVLCLAKVQSYSVTVDAHAEECFFEVVEAGTKMGLIFEIAEGGFLDIDVKLTDPAGVVLYEGTRESSGKFAFQASTSGKYTYCFSNAMSTMTPKVVMFNMEVGEPPKTNDHDDATPNKLEDMIKELGGTLKTVKHEQEYMQLRDRIHRSINESTNSRVLTWSIFEACVLIVMTVGQVYYLKRFFEVQRVV